MQENNLKGLWVPYEILTNEPLSDKEKYIYSLILFFSKNDGYCTITNKYIATIVNLSDTRVSKLISSLIFYFSLKGADFYANSKWII